MTEAERRRKNDRNRRIRNQAKWEGLDPREHHPTGKKRCSNCRRIKKVKEFGVSRGRADGLQPMCGECWRTTKRRQYHNQNYRRPIPEDARCEICGSDGKDPITGKKKLCRDHSHETGKERGFLCLTCNWGIGCFRDNRALLSAARKYLARYDHNR